MSEDESGEVCTAGLRPGSFGGGQEEEMGREGAFILILV